MKKKILYTAYALLFLIICAVPAALMPFVKAEDTKENRKLSQFPEIKKEDGSLNTDWAKEFDTYFSEHFGFRSDLVNAHNTMLDAVFGSSGEEDVIIGRDGWLYYSYTADDYMGTNRMSDWEIEDIAHTLKMMQDYTEKNGSKLIFAGVPNKNTIYPEYMPYNYLQAADKSDLERLEEVLEREGVNYCSLNNILKTQKTDSPDTLLYHKEDTHWNNYGAYTAYRALFDTVGMSKIDLEISGSSDTWEGDLRKMLFPDSDKKDQQIDYDFTPTYNYVGRFRGLDDIMIRTAGNGNGSILMFRDSFGEAILPFIAESCETAMFSRAVPYKLDTLEQEHFDTVIVEIVERNLKNLRKKAPEMPSPECGELNAVEISSDIVSGFNCTEDQDMIKVFGSFGKDTAPESVGRIYLKANGKTYEAFPVYECSEENGIKGFSVNIPDDEPDLQNIEYELIAEIDGRLVSNGSNKK